MSRKKKRRFAEIEIFENVFDRQTVLNRPGWWRKYFPHDRAVTLELGCGKGDLTLELGRRFSDRNFLGIDRKGERIWKGAKAAIQEQLVNVAFLKARIEDLPVYMENNIVEEIWITYPDPLPKRRQVKHRLLAPAFLEIYRNLLQPGGIIHLKTDDLDLFHYAEEVIENTRLTVHSRHLDLYASQETDPLLKISTAFEKRHLEAGRRIRYLCFGFE